MGRFAVGEIPWARRQPQRLVCPFCGNPSATVSLNDVEADPVRLELYCDSGAGEAREFAVVLLRANLRQDLVRADVAALRAVDDGTEAEQHAEGHDTVVGLDVVLARHAAAHGRTLLERRQRPSRDHGDAAGRRRDGRGRGSWVVRRPCSAARGWRRAPRRPAKLNRFGSHGGASGCRHAGSLAALAQRGSPSLSSRSHSPYPRRAGPQPLPYIEV
jgi:hypothetical protein